MSEIRVKENESLESALRRFKRKTARDGILAEARKREHYEKPSVKRKKKAEAARIAKGRLSTLPVFGVNFCFAGRAARSPVAVAVRNWPSARQRLCRPYCG